eukprot:GDKH01003154.1.p3 GENE.GDKH01003154.1~~GDKH01003154.1.p3  ORF type:complete len:60 (+),score=2.64 GDKH01003154.1:308-487(+)
MRRRVSRPLDLFSLYLQPHLLVVVASRNVIFVFCCALPPAVVVMCTVVHVRYVCLAAVS